MSLSLRDSVTWLLRGWEITLLIRACRSVLKSLIFYILIVGYASSTFYGWLAVESWQKNNNEDRNNCFLGVVALLLCYFISLFWIIFLLILLLQKSLDVFRFDCYWIFSWYDKVILFYFNNYYSDLWAQRIFCNPIFCGWSCWDLRMRWLYLYIGSNLPWIFNFSFFFAIADMVYLPGPKQDLLQCYFPQSNWDLRNDI